MDIWISQQLKKLEDRGYTVHVFAAGEDAANYLDAQIDRTTVGLGGSMTLEELRLHKRLNEHNDVFWHQRVPDGRTHMDVRHDAARAAVCISPVNGLAESEEIVNIDRTGNRAAAIFFGHDKVYHAVGKNKLTKDYDSALWRARDMASSMNTRRAGVNTPCAVRADKCYDCRSPERICRGHLVLWEKLLTGDIEVLLVDEDLGYRQRSSGVETCSRHARHHNAKQPDTHPCAGLFQ